MDTFSDATSVIGIETLGDIVSIHETVDGWKKLIIAPEDDD